jgi:predicted enzyme related to lactoylglutathione lyase
LGREKLTDDIDGSVNIYADLFEITTDHLQQSVINISVTHDDKKTQGEGGMEREREIERGREKEKSRGTWPALFRARILSRD